MSNDILTFAADVRHTLARLGGVHSCRLYGSLSAGTWDLYSDVDIELDVSGLDNGRFLVELPDLLAQHCPVIFYDFAPSLAPEKYVVTVALDERHPFRLVDVACVATPHRTAVTQQELHARNHPYDHTLKLFTANLKHFLRGADCRRDIEKMHRRVFSEGERGEWQQLAAVYGWLCKNSEARHEAYLNSLAPHMHS